ncbi:MAG: peptidoglycan-associated lipoprotein Pal [Alphaproteobacteria bacterium]|nr:peptidoglycan-associated lipoprotein Pal [Alphaproteobacteria bacterium]
MRTSKVLLPILASVLLVACTSTKKTDSVGASSPNGSGNTGDSSSVLAPYPGDKAELGKDLQDRVFFGFNSSDLDSTSTAILENQARWLSANKSKKVVVEGHADERGTREFNLALGERRANAVKEYLTGHGVDSSRVKTISYGKERPAVQGSSEESWAQNRRSVLIEEQK